MDMFRRFFMLMGLLALAGCATIPSNVPPDYKLSGASGKGVLVASIVYSGTEYGALSYHLGVVGQGTTTILTVDPGRLVGPDALDWGPRSSRRPADWVGRLVAIELPPGDYRLERMVFRSGRSSWTGTSVPERTFKVISGKAVYVGQIHTHMKNVPGKGLMYIAARFDARETDLPLLKEKFAFIQPDQLVLDLPPAPPPSKGKPIESLPDLTQGANRGLNDLSGLLPAK